MKNIYIRGLGLLVLSLLLSYFFSGIFGEFYNKIIGPSGSLVDTTSLIGLPLAYIFFITLLYSAFTGDGKYWFIGILLVPPAGFELYFDVSHIYFPIIIGLVGWLIGYGISKMMHK